jgi:hypothetical protein
VNSGHVTTLLPQLNRRDNQLIANSASGGTVVMRADRASYSGPVRRVGARFPVMVQIDPKIATAIARLLPPSG